MEFQLLRDANRVEEGYAVLEEALVAQPDNAELLYETAMIAERQNRIEVAEQRLRRVLAHGLLQAQAAHLLVVQGAPHRGGQLADEVARGGKVDVLETDEPGHRAAAQAAVVDAAQRRAVLTVEAADEAVHRLIDPLDGERRAALGGFQAGGDGVVFFPPTENRLLRHVHQDRDGRFELLGKADEDRRLFGQG